MMSNTRHPVLFSSATVVVVAIGIAVGAHFAHPDPTDLVTIPPGTISYRAAGDFTRDGAAVDAPRVTIAFDRPLVVMRTQVSVATYGACVSAGACDGLDDTAGRAARADMPAVGLSWRDATAFAAWLSQTTGHHYRLPSDEEWVRLAADANVEEASIAAADPTDPSKRWLAAYDAEAAKAEPVDPTPRPFGTFGINSLGLADVSGNVWEWTNGCWSRQVSGAAQATRKSRNCGVRIVQGRHRGYISDFVRDPRGGACSIGVPPSNLGVRLIRDDPTILDRIASLVH